MVSVGTYLFLCFIDMSSQVLRPLVYSTSIENGGLGFDPYTIGIIMGAWGIINALLQLFFLGKLIRRFGARKMYILSQINYLISFALYPLLTYLVRRSGTTDAKVWTVLIIQLLFHLTNSMSYGMLLSPDNFYMTANKALASIMILIIDSAPNRASVGATNGLAQAVGCAMRSIAPSAASSLFSISLERQLAGGNMVYIVIMGICILGLRSALLLPKHSKTEKR